MHGGICFCAIHTCEGQRLPTKAGTNEKPYLPICSALPRGLCGFYVRSRPIGHSTLAQPTGSNTQYETLRAADDTAS